MCLKTMADENWISNFGCDLNGGILVVGVWWTYKFEVLCVGIGDLFFLKRQRLAPNGKRTHVMCLHVFGGGQEK